MTADATRGRRALGDALVVDDAGSLFGRLVPWDTVAEVTDDGRHGYRESFRRGGLRATGVVPVYAGHSHGRNGLEHGPLVGRVEELEDRADGLYGRVVLADVPAAADLRALARTVGATFSVEFEDPTGAPPPGGTIARTGAVLSGLAVLTAPHRGAYRGAEVLSVRTRAPEVPMPTATDVDPNEDLEDLDDDEETTPPTDPPTTTPPADPPAAAPDASSARAAITREVRRELNRRAGRTATAHPLARFRSAYEFLTAARTDGGELSGQFRDAYDAHRARVWADQVTADNPGVMPPGWLNEVFGIIDMGRPVITGIGSRPLPESGMEIDWPYFDGDLHALVGEQAAQKTEIVSVEVNLKKGSTPLKTYAGGSDVSWQLIRRSSPAYRDAYLRIMQSAYAVVTDKAVAVPLVAGAGATIDYDAAAADANGTALRKAVFEASTKIQVATGAPASIVLASTPLFIAFGGMPMLVPSTYGTQNVAGTATASTLDVSISGLPVVHAPDLDAAAVGIVTNRLACSWFEDGPFVVAAPDVPKLGEDIAIWGMGALGITNAKGVIKLANTTP